MIPSLAMAVPEGYDPVVAFKLCPPGGIMFQLGLYIYAASAALGSFSLGIDKAPEV